MSVTKSAARPKRAVPKSIKSRFHLPAAIWSPLLVLFIWEALAWGGLIETRFFPAPSMIISKLIQEVGDRNFWMDIGLSVRRMVIGFAMGAIPGTVLGLSMGLFRPVREFFQPLIAAFYPLPKIAILPLILLIFGLGEASKHVIVAIGVFFIMVINISEAVTQIPRIYFDVAMNLRASKWEMYKTVAFPGSLPGIFTGLRLSTGVALLLLVSAEFVGANEGLGYRIWWSWSVFWVEPMYVGLFVISILGYLSSNLVGVVERLVLPWKRR